MNLLRGSVQSQKYGPATVFKYFRQQLQPLIEFVGPICRKGQITIFVVKPLEFGIRDQQMRHPQGRKPLLPDGGIGVSEDRFELGTIKRRWRDAGNLQPERSSFT